MKKRLPIVWEPDQFPSVEEVGLSPEEQRAAQHWEKYLPRTVAALKAQGPLAFPTAIRKAAHRTMYAEELEMANNPRLSRQQARSIFQGHWLFPPPE